MLSASYDHIHMLARLPGIRTLHDAWKTSSLRVSRTRTKFYVSTPPHNTSNNTSNTSNTSNNNSNSNSHDLDRPDNVNRSSSCEAVPAAGSQDAPDLVRDLLHAERPVSLRQFFHWPSLKTHLWRSRRQRQCQSLQPHFRLNVPQRLRATPIIVVENYDGRQVQRARTDLVLHPHTTQATLGTILAVEPAQAVGQSAKKLRRSSSSCGFWSKRWPLFRSKSERKTRVAPTEATTADCNDCVTQ